MKWYLAKVVFQIVCGDGSHIPQFDEQLRLIEAKDEIEAYQKAFVIGENEAEQFYNEKQKLIQWKFINIAELYKLSELMDGAELYSRVQETENADNYIDTINKKAANIRLNSTHRFLEIF